MHTRLISYAILIIIILSTSTDLRAQLIMRSFPPGASLAKNTQPPADCPISQDDETKSNDTQKQTNKAENPIGALVVYGRTACGVTKKYIKEFEKAGVAFVFKDIDNPAINKEFTNKAFDAGMEGSINLPIIENNGQLTQRPNLAEILKEKAPNYTQQKEKTEAKRQTTNINEDKLVVYGSRGCSITKRYINELQEAKIKFTFCDIDTSSGNKEFQETISGAGFSGSIDLPVINDHGKIAIRPKLATLLNKGNAITNNKQQSIGNSKPIVIYSNKNCKITKQYMSDLTDLEIKYVFKDVNDSNVHKEFSKELAEAGYTGSINLPVVIVKNKVLITPSVATTIKEIKA